MCFLHGFLYHLLTTASQRGNATTACQLYFLWLWYQFCIMVNRKIFCASKNSSLYEILYLYASWLWQHLYNHLYILMKMWLYMIYNVHFCETGVTTLSFIRGLWISDTIERRVFFTSFITMLSEYCHFNLEWLLLWLISIVVIIKPKTPGLFLADMYVLLLFFFFSAFS